MKSEPSSLSFALFEEDCEDRIAHGAVEMIGRSDEQAWLTSEAGHRAISRFCGDHLAAMRLALHLALRINGGYPKIVAHRLRLGSAASDEAVVLDEALLAGMGSRSRLATFRDRASEQGIVEGLRLARLNWPLVLQIACFEAPAWALFDG